jgi:DNA (cytosine-5)-methyltransferase 1
MASKFDAGRDIEEQITEALNQAFTEAEQLWVSGMETNWGLSIRINNALSKMSDLSQKASTGFTNIVTCLAIKAARPDVDVRYHQVQIQGQTDRGAGFNFRGLSEKVVYPWLNSHTFEGAKSGWQTRTFERPKPYMLSYDENIGDIKDYFLAVFDELEEHGQSAKDALMHLIYLQIVQRESKRIVLSKPRTQDIQLIVNLFHRHFFYPYNASKGASRLPVLALYAVYSLLITQLDRFKGMELKPLEEHSAADAQTGSVGDIEVVNIKTKEVYEAVEIKHNIAINERLIQDAATKIMNRTVDRYYILTTHSSCEPNDLMSKLILQIKLLYQCQIIANGVIPSIKYYLRLLSDPSMIFQEYISLLEADKAVKHEHREVWNKIAI